MNPETIERPTIGWQRRGGTQAKPEWLWSLVSRLCAIGFFWMMVRCFYVAVTFSEPRGVAVVWLGCFGISSGCTAVAMWWRAGLLARGLSEDRGRRDWWYAVCLLVPAAVYANSAFYSAVHSEPGWMVIAAVLAAAFALDGARELLRR